MARPLATPQVRLAYIRDVNQFQPSPSAIAPRSREDLRLWIIADLEAHGLDRWRPVFRVTQRVAHYQRLRRHAEYWRFGVGVGGRLRPVVAGVLALRVRLLGERLGFTIPLGTIGPGLRLAHVGSIVVHHRSRIGADCTLHQGVTIGEANGRIATLGDGCHLAPNATVLGAHLGNRVGVWANAVVTHDFGDDVSVAGVPAKPVHGLRSVPQGG